LSIYIASGLESSTPFGKFSIQRNFGCARNIAHLCDSARGRVLLADARGIKEIETEAKEMLSTAEWNAFRKATSIQPLFVEHRIPY
jgi:hypothetical protein